MRQYDVKTAYSHGEIDKEIYLKQAGRMWNKTLTKHLKNLGLEQAKYVHSLFFNNTIGSAFLFLLTYVNDILVVTNNQQLEYDIING
jgi:hypothetical protein